MAGKVAGKVAFVSGGARGLGAGFARILAEEGAAVIVSDMLEAEGRALVANIGDRARFVRHDVTSADQWHAAVAAGEEAFGPISILCNNAGVHDSAPLTDTSEAQYRRVIDINQIGVFLGMQAVVPSMRRAGGGSIVNSSSTAGLAGFPAAYAYVASKWAVRGMTKSAALELGVDRIRVNSIHPGLIETPMTTGFAADTSQPIPRAGRIDEVAKLVLFLASDDSSYSTGAEFVVDGGATSMVGTPPPSPKDGIRQKRPGP